MTSLQWENFNELILTTLVIYAAIQLWLFVITLATFESKFSIKVRLAILFPPTILYWPFRKR